MLPSALRLPFISQSMEAGMSHESDGYIGITTGGAGAAASSAADNIGITPDAPEETLPAGETAQQKQAANAAAIKAMRSRVIKGMTAYLQARKLCADTRTEHDALETQKAALLEKRNKTWGATIVLVDEASAAQLD